MNPILYAIPFFLLIGVEIWVAKRRRQRIYRLNDSIADLGCGMIQQLLGVAVALVTGRALAEVQQRFGVFSIDPHLWWTWLALFLGVDFFYYWFHRLSHEIAFLWAIHVVHHQSEEYNLAVALRQAAFQPAVSWFFYLPLAWIGFPAPMLFGMIGINTIYQFWIHTRLIGRLGPFELLFNTPSHHRVHHGQNARYIDRNHGGTLIIWDRLFGTFELESEPVVFGVNRPLHSWNPLWANFRAFADLFDDARELPRFRDKLKLMLMKPGWWPGSDEIPHTPVLERFDTPSTKPLRTYVLLQFVPAVLGTVGFLWFAPRWPMPQLLALGAAVVLSLVALSALLEQKPWAKRLEIARLAAIALGGVAVLVTAG